MTSNYDDIIQGKIRQIETELIAAAKYHPETVKAFTNDLTPILEFHKHRITNKGASRSENIAPLIALLNLINKAIGFYEEAETARKRLLEFISTERVSYNPQSLLSSLPPEEVRFVANGMDVQPHTGDRHGDNHILISRTEKLTQKTIQLDKTIALIQEKLKQIENRSTLIQITGQSLPYEGGEPKISLKTIRDGITAILQKETDNVKKDGILVDDIARFWWHYSRLDGQPFATKEDLEKCFKKINRYDGHPFWALLTLILGDDSESEDEDDDKALKATKALKRRFEDRPWVDGAK